MAMKLYQDSCMREQQIGSVLATPTDDVVVAVCFVLAVFLVLFILKERFVAVTRP
jgi:hypothetical protein